KANSIYVSGSDIYVAGYYYNGTNNIACYWKNGSKTGLSAGNASEANSIYLSGSDIYVAGYYNNGSNNIACYWKIAVKQNYHQK
ncbi:MAG TPA: hypothetical protein PLX16_06410, partial [Exilispira sp.]|nr:hypothetical protein [Exilispira sp.]